MIRELKKSEIPGLNNLPPTDWKFDYEEFLTGYINEDFKQEIIHPIARLMLTMYNKS